ncbi:MAG: hypothetical protein H8E82_04470 [Candidatus Marinimicrobia bacterium]|nr:hypothetical protein [Candidatus Neomarinimicrobiota bacterium]
MKQKNLKDLEYYFAEKFDTALFPVLAEHYLLNGDYERAHKVCKIGLEHHPNSLEGQFIEARIFMMEGDLIKTEKILKQIIKMDFNYYNAYIHLADVQEQLGRASNTLRKLYKIILKMDSQNQRALDQLEEIENKEKHKEKFITTLPKEKSSKRGSLDHELLALSISPEIATFTLVTVLKDQRLYERALEVIAVMSKKPGVDIERVSKEREKLEKLLKKQRGKR